MKCRYMTIEREYGSGGTKIAHLVSEKTGISCFGTEILQQVSEDKNIPYDQIERYEETVTNSFLYSIYMMSQAAAGKTDMLTKEGHIYVEEQAVIRRLAADRPAIFLGHCAAEALKEQDGVVRVFIRCSNEAAKKKRIMEDYHIPQERIESVRRRFDKKRSNYYYANTGKKWDDLKAYDIVLDTGHVGIEACADVLAGLYRKE